MAKTKFINQTHIEGYIYESKLEQRITGENSKNPGTPFIMGNLDVATDNALTNIVSVHFTYVTPTTAKGTENATYTVLKGIIDKKYKTIMADGKDNAHKVRIDSTLGLNEFYSSRTGAEELVSAKRNEGGFVHIVDQINEDEAERSTFKVDMVITGVTRIEPDEEKNLPEKAIIKGCVFDFKGALLPVELTTLKTGAIDYFESLEASAKNPIFTKVWGQQLSQTITKTYTEEGAWGEDSVRTVQSTRKDWIITNAMKETYSFGTDEDCDLTQSFFLKAIADREVYLATIKARQEEYKASKASVADAAPAAANTSGATFNF